MSFRLSVTFMYERISSRRHLRHYKPPGMKNTLAFLLLVLVLLFPLGGFLGPALTLQCNRGSNTSHQKNEYVNITIVDKKYDQINRTIYVKPQRDMPMKVMLEVQAYDGASKTRAEFSLDEDCFKSDTEWWQLFVKVKYFKKYGNNHPNQYKLQVRTSTCIKPCMRNVYMEGVESLHVLTSGVSSWTPECPEDCHGIPQWNETAHEGDFPQCNAYKTPSSPSTTDSASTTTPSTPITSIAKHAATSAPYSPAVIGGIGGVAGITVAVLVLVAVMRQRRRGESPTQDVSIRPKNTDSPREDRVNNQYEPDGRQEPVYENVDRQGSVSILHEPGARQEPVYENVDRQGSVNSLYETVSRQGSVNSLYEPFENFRPTR